MFRMVKIALIGLLFSSPVLADRDWGDHHHRRHHHHHHHHRHHYRPHHREIIYMPERIVEYVPARPRYYAPPPPPSRYRYDQRTPQGLAGGMLGSAIGYEMGRGDPLAAGIGAATGSWIGNGMY